MEIEMILGSDMVGRIYEKFGGIAHPVATISFEELSEDIPEEIPEFKSPGIIGFFDEGLEEITAEDTMYPEELGVLDEIESEIVHESSIFDSTDLINIEDFI